MVTPEADHSGALLAALPQRRQYLPNLRVSEAGSGEVGTALPAGVLVAEWSRLPEALLFNLRFNVLIRLELAAGIPDECWRVRWRVPAGVVWEAHFVLWIQIEVFGRCDVREVWPRRK